MKTTVTHKVMNLLSLLLTLLCATTMSGCTADDKPLFEKKEVLPSFDLPAGWEWRQSDGVIYPLTAMKYYGERPSDKGSDCDCPIEAHVIEIDSPTRPGSEEDARQEVVKEFEGAKAACDYERQYDPDVGDCGYAYQETKIAGRDIYVFLTQGMDGQPVSLFAFVKEGNVVRGSVSGRVDEHFLELETVISTLTWK